MKLYELENKDLETAYYDPQGDQINSRRFNDTRKPILTLKDLNKLKKLRAVKKLEALKREDTISIMYSGGDEQGGEGPTGF